ncbi:MAG: laccase [Proteobacteria bacterium]|nr:laccase [Pseudomonadota bacterium]
MPEPQFIFPDWPASKNVRAAVTTRIGGVSHAPYDSFNLATHVGDDLAAVRENRARLRIALALPAEPLWLKQVHGVVVADAVQGGLEPEADGAFAAQSGAVCAVLTADCLPVLLCNREGTKVAALHAGWRGLAGGVIESGVQAMGIPGGELLAWLGPAIGPQVFEVGPEVRTTFIEHDTQTAQAFRAAREGKYLADIYQLARLRLQRLGVAAVYGGGFCTVTDSARFFSYRRDGATGRMASLIWLADG